MSCRFAGARGVSVTPDTTWTSSPPTASRSIATQTVTPICTGRPAACRSPSHFLRFVEGSHRRRASATRTRRSARSSNPKWRRCQAMSSRHCRTAASECRCSPTCPASHHRCGHGGSAGTAATPAATNCGIRVPPETFGLSSEGGALPFWERLGSSDIPVDVGWFVHHIRPTKNGSEMRSRFWLGGPHIAVRSGPGLAARIVRPVASRVVDISAGTARDLRAE